MTLPPDPIGRTLAIRAGWVVAFDGRDHAFLTDGVVAWRDGRITHVGRDLPADVDEVIEAPGKLLIPGLISTHAHVSTHTGDRLVLDQGRRDLLFTGFLNYQTRRLPDGASFGAFEDRDASARYGFAALLRSGVTTVLDMGTGCFDGAATMVAAAGLSGIRLYYGPFLAVGDYVYGERGEVVRRMFPGEEREQLDRAEAFIRENDGAHDGRIRGAVVVDELFTSTPELLTGAKDLADRMGVPITIHLAEQVFEFHETLRQTGRTPVGYLRDLGVLGPNLIAAHCLYVSGHSATAYPYRGDLEALAEAGCTVAHAPAALSRRGVALEDFRRYREHGVRLSIGTDSYPQDILYEMQLASVFAKVVTRDHEAAPAAEVFHAATLGGAAALNRPDLGRIAPGASADLVLVDLTDPRYGPVFDPIRALIHCGTSEQVERVIVAGRTVVADRRVLFADEGDLVASAGASARNAWANCARVDRLERPVGQAFPPSYPAW